jgi:hypothetical protein
MSGVRTLPRGAEKYGELRGSAGATADQMVTVLFRCWSSRCPLLSLLPLAVALRAVGFVMI